MSNLNEDIRVAIETGEIEQARQLLRDALLNADADTYYMAAQAAVDDDQRREFLEKAVEKNPFHKEAREALKALDAKPVPVSKSSSEITNTSNNSTTPTSQTPGSIAPKTPIEKRTEIAGWVASISLGIAAFGYYRTFA